MYDPFMLSEFSSKMYDSFCVFFWCFLICRNFPPKPLSLLDRNTLLLLFFFSFFFLFLKMYFSLPQLFGFLFDVLSQCCRVCHQGQICKKADLCLNLYTCAIKYYLFSVSVSRSLVKCVLHAESASGTFSTVDTLAPPPSPAPSPYPPLPATNPHLPPSHTYRLPPQTHPCNFPQ